jgi:hypothetical protein
MKIGGGGSAIGGQGARGWEVGDLVDRVGGLRSMVED